MAVTVYSNCLAFEKKNSAAYHLKISKKSTSANVKPCATPRPLSLTNYIPYYGQTALNIADYIEFFFIKVMSTIAS